jgi:putative holliday junction resolvase
MRFLGVDLGSKRIGLAVSDTSGTLARPWRTVLAAGTPQAWAASVAALIAAPPPGDDVEPGAFAGIVVGVPHRLNGEPTGMTQPAMEFARALSELTGHVVRLQDERLTSHEAESRLAVNERDWRKRKLKIDAAAAAIILQDYLDARTSPAPIDAGRA